MAGDNSVSSSDTGDLPGLWDTLPQIVAIGGQSAGKSSVIEAIVGRDFLPRGAGICTRRPLVLQLLQAPPAAGEVATFLHQKGKVYDISASAVALRDEIEAETQRSLGPGKAVSAEPIMLTIRSPRVPNLTLVDMPGITKIATDNQPQSIVRDLEEMSRAYVRPKNTVILAVSPANADIATSDAMRLVREFDPQGERTLGVLTKLDLMDKGTDAREVLEGKSLFLRHGWVGVVNRSQQDINTKADLQAARDKERAFFASKPEYGHLKTGYANLVETLTRLLERAIKRAVPDIQAHISKSSRALEQELRSLGAELPADRGGRLHAIMQLLDALDRSFQQLMEGGRGGGERVRGIFDSALPSALRELPFHRVFGLTAVRDVIETADGLQPHLLAPELGMRRLIRDGVALLRAPSLAVVDAVHTALCDAVHTSLEDVAASHPEVARYTTLRDAMLNTALASLAKCRDEARKTVTTLVEMEQAYYTASFFRDDAAQAAGVQLALQLGLLPAAWAQPADAGSPAETHATSDGPAANGGSKPATALRRFLGPGGSTAGGVLNSDGSADLSPEIAAHLRRVSTTVGGYVATVCDGLRKAIPKAVVYTQVQAAKKALLGPLYAELGGITDAQLTQLLGGALVCPLLLPGIGADSGGSGSVAAEDPAAVERRQAVLQRLQLLRKARDEIHAAIV